MKSFGLQIMRSRSFLRILLTIPPNPTASGTNLLAFDLETCIFSSCMKELRRFGGREASQAVRGGTGSHSQQLTCPGIKRDLERLQSSLSCSCSSVKALVCSASRERLCCQHWFLQELTGKGKICEREAVMMMMMIDWGQRYQRPPSSVITGASTFLYARDWRLWWRHTEIHEQRKSLIPRLVWEGYIFKGL